MLSDNDRAVWALYWDGPAPGAVPAPSPSRGSAARLPSARRPAGTLGLLRIGERPTGMDDLGWRRLGAPRAPVDCRLDLHGHTAAAAHDAVLACLRGAWAARRRCLEVVTGRGGAEGGVIRREFPHWINHPDIRRMILAATWSQAGNPGAVRLLLRRRR